MTYHGSGVGPRLGLSPLRDERSLHVVRVVQRRIQLGQPLGCGGVKLPPGKPAFLKRMWVAPSARGLGIAALMLDRLEVIARDAGATSITLDTNSLLVAAGRMYESRGYRLLHDFNGEKHADRWYRKDW